jgi:type I restriction enzyme S subunit
MAKQPEQILEEQTKIANFLSAIDEKINRTQNQITQTENWKGDCYSNYFVKFKIK